MEYQVRTDRSIDRDTITVAILHWLRNTHPVGRGAQMGAAAGSLGGSLMGRSASPGSTFGRPTQPGRLSSPFGSPTQNGAAPVELWPGGRGAGSAYPITSPGHNVHSPHQMQVAGEVSIAPHLFIRQSRTTGGSHHHLFVLGDHSVLTVQQQSYHYRWGQPGQHWHKPLLLAHPPALLPADITTSLVQQALQHNAGAVSQMSGWQKLLWAAMEGCRTVNLGTAVWEDVIKPMLNWESAGILLGILVLCAIPYVGEVVLVLLMGAAIYDMVTRVAGLFKQYYEAAINATTYEGLQQAARFFSSAIIGGLLDILALVAGGGALARMRVLRAQGRLTVGAWVEALAEWGQQLARRLRSGGKMLERLVEEAKNVAKGKKKPKIKTLQDNFADLAAERQRLKLPAAGSATDDATMAKIKIGNDEFYGVNSKYQNPKTKVGGKVNAQTKTHAEGEAVQKAIDAGKKGSAKEAEMWVDRDACDACGKYNGIGSLARELGVDKITVHSPSGTKVYYPPKKK